MPIAPILVLLTLQGALTPPVKEARLLAKTAQAYADKHPKDKKMYMLLGDKKWVAMRKDTDHLKDEMWREDVSMVAFAWARNGKAFFVSYTGGSPSGDWTAQKSDTYRPDGTLAHTSYHFGAFMFSGRSLDEETVFDQKGKKIFTKVELTDLKGKRITSAEERGQMFESRPDMKDYLRASQLPFGR